MAGPCHARQGYACRRRLERPSRYAARRDSGLNKRRPLIFRRPVPAFEVCVLLWVDTDGVQRGYAKLDLRACLESENHEWI